MQEAPSSKQFEIVRQKLEASDGKYTLDGRSCPACNHATVIGSDLKRRYCTRDKCNALMLEEPESHIHTIGNHVWINN